MVSMIWAAVSGVMTINVMADMVRNIQARSGILPRVMPGQRMQRTVVTMLTAVPTVPKPARRMASVQ